MLKRTCGLWFMLGIFLAVGGNSMAAEAVDRSNFGNVLTQVCKEKYQARIVCKPVDDTVWIYLPYTPGRSGFSASKAEDNNLRLEYKVASINPYKVLEPPELKFVTQKIIGEIRQVMLQNGEPYKFFVLAISDITSKLNSSDQWFIGYFEDLKKYNVGLDFSGEGYARLAWYLEKVGAIKDGDGNLVAESYLDIDGKHVNYHAVLLKEFVEKQINWRIYKRFTVDYNKTPFNLSARDKQDEVIFIVKTVLKAYNFKDFDNIYLRDMSMLEEEGSYAHFTRGDIETYPTSGITRKPSF